MTIVLKDSNRPNLNPDPRQGLKTATFNHQTHMALEYIVGVVDILFQEIEGLKSAIKELQGRTPVVEETKKPASRAKKETPEPEVETKE